MRNQENTRQTARPSTSKIWRFNGIAAAVAIALGGLAAVPGQAFAAAPDAGTSIGNIASADYTDSTSTPRTTQSNPVTTTVRQIASLTLTAPNNAFVTPGGQLVYPHTLTNTGNGNDTFLLTVSNSGGVDQFDLGSLAIYADSDGNGIPDNAINLNNTTVSLPRNGVFTFVVVGFATGPGSTTNLNTAITTVNADSQVFDLTADDPTTVSNLDTATVTSDAVINVTKSADVITGPTGTVIEYTLTYRNTGNNTATGVTIEDVIPDTFPSPTAGFDYELDSYAVGSGGLWSGSATPLTNAVAGDPAGITYEYDAGLKKVIAVISSVAPNVTGTIKFKVKVGSTTPPGVVTNTAEYSYDANGAAVGGAVGPLFSNDQNFTVLQTLSVAANDSTTVSTTGGVDDTNDAFAADGVTAITPGNPANPGDTVVFKNEIWNNGNGTDTFNITLSGSTFPVGTTFQLYKSDGVNVLLTTDSDGIPDTGPVAPGGRYEVIVKATLPSNATGTGPFTVTKTAVSNLGGTPDIVTDRLSDLAAATVDITNNAAVGGGVANGDGPGTNTVITTNTVNPGASTNFTLFVNNTSAIADNYDLLADDDGTFGGVNDLPAGWTVVFHSGSCAGTVITNTGTINAGSNLQVCAVVSVPAGQTPVTTNLFFRSKSPLTNAGDYKVDAVSVNTIRNVSILSSTSGQVAPNGTVTYTHVITNEGNVPETDVAIAVVAGFSTTLYYDANGNGLLDASDPVVTNINALATGNASDGLSPAEQMTIFAVVSGPAGATDGQQDSEVITVTSPGDSNAADNTNTDTTTVRFGQVRLAKTQGLDTDCNGTPEAAAPNDFVASALAAKPGECIVYKIVATNEGSQPVTGVVISDSTPTYTKVSAAPTPATTKGAITAPATNATGLVTATVGPMAGSEVVTVTFGVKVDN